MTVIHLNKVKPH